MDDMLAANLIDEITKLRLAITTAALAVIASNLQASPDVNPIDVAADFMSKARAQASK